MKPEITLADALALRRLKKAAPNTWTAWGEFYTIIRKYCPDGSDNWDLLEFAERTIKAMEQSG
jgi:hypothetical protein